MDFTSRYQLTKRQVKNKKGLFAVWRGEVDPKLAKQSILTQFSTDLGESEISESGYIWAISDLEDLLSLMQFSPDAILELPSYELTSLNNKGGLCGTKLANLTERVVNSRLKFKGLKERWKVDSCCYEQPLYDRVLIKPGNYRKSDILFFTVPLGGTVKNRSQYIDNKPFQFEERLKTHRDTNMDQGGSLPYPKNFIFNGFSILKDPDSDSEDFKNLINACWFRVLIGTMSYYDVPAYLVSGFLKSSDYQVKLPTPAGPHFELSQPYELISQQHFRLELNLCSNKEITIKKLLGIQCILWGHFTRKVIC